MTILFPLADLYTFKINLMFDKIPSWKQRNDSKQYKGDLDGVSSTPGDSRRGRRERREGTHGGYDSF